MKKVVSIVLAIVLICSILPHSFALSDLTKFDYETILGNREGYSYDKFDRSWSYYRAYVENYSDARLIIGLQTGSLSGEINPSLNTLYVKILDRSGNPLYTVESIDFLIGDDMYSFENMLADESSSTVILAEKGQALLKAFRDCDPSKVSVRIGVKNRGNLSFDLDKTEFTNTIKEYATVYLKYLMWDYVEDKETANLYESFLPMKINGELA